MRAWGNNTDRLLAALDEFGPLTMTQLMEYLGLGKATVSPLLTRLRTGKTGAARPAPKRIYICRWVSGLPGKKNHLRPVYALGRLPDAPKPAPKPKWQTNAEQWATAKARAAAFAAAPAM